MENVFASPTLFEVVVSRFGQAQGVIKYTRDPNKEQQLRHAVVGDARLVLQQLIEDLMYAVDRAQTIVTHDSGHSRDQTIPFYEAIVPRGYLGWGNSSQLGYGLGLAMGAKLGSLLLGRRKLFRCILRYRNTCWFDRSNRSAQLVRLPTMAPGKCHMFREISLIWEIQD